jgi:NADH-quinone oxidoreductase subunit G
VRIDHRDGNIFRLIPRRNVEVNKSWLCDEGRLSFHELAKDERLLRPLAKGRDGIQAPVTWEDAVGAIDSRLREIRGASGERSIAGFASASATNEALFLFKRYLGTARYDFRLDSEDKQATEKEDGVLRHLDKHPNSIGALKIGLTSGTPGGIEDLTRAAKSGEIRAGMVVYQKPLVRRPEDEQAEARVAALVEALEYSVVLAAHKAAWQSAASVLLPIAAWSEEDGTFTNFQGRVQLAGKAKVAPGDALPLWEVLAMLIHARGDQSPWMSAEDVFRTLAESEPAFRGIEWEQTRLPGVIVA